MLFRSVHRPTQPDNVIEVVGDSAVDEVTARDGLVNSSVDGYLNILINSDAALASCISRLLYMASFCATVVTRMSLMSIWNFRTGSPFFPGATWNRSCV